MSTFGRFVFRNTFLSNNKLNGASGVFDIARSSSLVNTPTPFDIHANDYGSTMVAWDGVRIITNRLQVSSATCAGQDAGVDSGLDFVDCNDEDVLGETLAPDEMANLLGGNLGATTEPSSLPFPVVGKYTSQAIARDAGMNLNDLYLFPNPTSETLTIDFDNLLRGTKVLKIYNAQGQVVKTIEFSDTPTRKTISVEGLTVGVYQIVLMDSRGLAGASKFVKK